MLSVSMPNAATSSRVRRHRDEVLGDRRLVAAARRATSRAAVCALVIVSSVVNVFDDDDEQRLGGVEVAVASAKSVPSTLDDEAALEVAVAVVPQRLVGHRRPEVGAADADVDDVADRLAGVPAPVAASARGRRTPPSGRGPRGPRRRRPARRRRARRRAGMRSATCSTARSSVTLMCSPANIASMRSRSPAPRRAPEQAERLVGDPVLRVVHRDPGRLRDEALAPGRIGGEEVAELDVRDLVVVALQRGPGLGGGRHRAERISVTRPRPAGSPRG